MGQLLSSSCSHDSSVKSILYNTYVYEICDQRICVLIDNHAILRNIMCELLHECHCILAFRAMKGNRNRVKINWKPEISIDAFEHALNKSGCARIFLLFFSYNDRTAYYVVLVNSTCNLRLVHPFFYIGLNWYKLTAV